MKQQSTGWILLFPVVFEDWYSLNIPGCHQGDPCITLFPGPCIKDRWWECFRCYLFCRWTLICTALWTCWCYSFIIIHFYCLFHTNMIYEYCLPNLPKAAPFSYNYIFSPHSAMNTVFLICCVFFFATVLPFLNMAVAALFTGVWVYQQLFRFWALCCCFVFWSVSECSCLVLGRSVAALFPGVATDASF